MRKFRSVKVNAPALASLGDFMRKLQVKSGGASQVATKSDVDIVPDRSEWDASNFGKGFQR